MGMFEIFILISFACLVNGDNFIHFAKSHHKKYHNAAEENLSPTLRRSIFNKNVELIEKHNLEFIEGKHSYKMSINKFTDMTHDEVIANYTGRRSNYHHLHSSRNLHKRDFSPRNIFPNFIDYRLNGYVNSVKDQENCRSDWAFSVMGALEGQYAKKYGKLTKFSEQQLIDCNRDSIHGNWGCEGGFEESAFNYIKVHGIISAIDYSYKGHDSICNISSFKPFAKFTSFVGISVSEEALLQAVAAHGPISVAIYANNEFQHYSEGIFSTKNCKTHINHLNHAVLVVGYGTDAVTGLDYWIVKNSWGAHWGENGYIRMRRNFHNMCGIASNGLFVHGLHKN